MNNYYLQVEKGKELLTKSKIIVCSIVRDCSYNLRRNLITINNICKSAKEYNIIVFENDSVDNTKEVLTEWSLSDEKVHIILNDFNSTTIPKKTRNKVNPYFSEIRISKMAKYRNQYLDYIRENEIKADLIIIVDLDVAYIDIQGVYHSLGFDKPWDAIAANSYSLSPSFKKRYHDTYALVEDLNVNIPQTEKSILDAQKRYSGLKKGHSMLKVFSAFGGLTIYKYNAISNLKYQVLLNNDEKVEVRCEHFSLHKQMFENGFINMYINPSMIVKYQKLTLKIIIKRLRKFAKLDF